MIGEKFGSLTVIEQLTERSWKCKCACGETIELFTSALLNGWRRSCGCQHSRHLSDKQQALNILWSRYKVNAKRRNIEFLMSKEIFENLVFSSCSFCGQIPNTPVNYRGREIALYNGIDRINGNKPYTDDNTQTCCWICNRAKGGLSTEQFNDWIKRTYINQFKKVTDKTPGELIDSLITTDIKCFYEQEKIMNSPEGSEEVLSAAKKAQELNAKRNKLMRSIDTVLDFEDDMPTEKTYG